MATAVAEIIDFPRMGRPSKARIAQLVERAEDAEGELLAHRSEALSFVDAVRPLVDRLHMVAVEIGPVAAQTVMALSAYIDRYESRHLPDDDGAAA